MNDTCCTLFALIFKVKVLRPTQHKLGHFGDVPHVLARYGRTKPNTATACIHQSKQTYYSTKYTQEIEARLSRLLQHPAGKRRGHILISALHKAVLYLFT